MKRDFGPTLPSDSQALGVESSRAHALLVTLALVIGTLACYGSVRDFEFTNFDDHRYITHNPVVLSGLNAQSIAWAFRAINVGNWHPITWLSHMLDCELYQLKDGSQWAGGHHLSNVILHVANTLLLFALLIRLTSTVWRSAFVAALFALHPLHVESVAWVSQRKDLLSAFFGFLTIWAYVEFTRTRRWTSYVAMLVCFALSLMSKPMLVTLPFVLLLLDFWPLRRLSYSAIIEKLPLFVIAIASCVVTVIAQARGGSISAIDEISLAGRTTNAIVACGVYLRQTVWPLNLGPFYPLQTRWPAWVVAAAVSVLAAITVIATAFSRRRPALLVGWLWFVGTLVPVIGLVQVGSQAHADRYTYVPLIGIFITIAWAIPDLGGRTRPWIAAICIIGLSLLGFHAIEQVQHWRNSVTLSQRALVVTDRNAVSHFNLGMAYSERGDLHSAIEEFKSAAEIKPEWTDVYYELGNAYRRNGELQSAITAYLAAIDRQPKHLDAINNLGMTFALEGDYTRAIETFKKALTINPNYAGANLNMGNALAATDKLHDAVIHYERALAAEPNNALTHLNLGNALSRLNRPEEAMRRFAKSIDLDATNPHAHLAMSNALANVGRIEDAIRFCEAAADLARQHEQWTLLNEIQHRIERFRAALHDR